MRSSRLLGLIVLLLIAVTPELVKAYDCSGQAILYDPRDTPVITKSCGYNHPAIFNCTIRYSKCMVTGLYTILLQDTNPGCSGMNEVYPFFFCDATTPNIKGTSPLYYSVNENNASDSINSWWKVYENDMVAYYPFEDDPATYLARDWSPYGHTINMSGTPAYRLGKAGNGKALRLDGSDDYLTLFHSLGNPVGMTISFWINASNTKSGRQFLFDAHKSGGNFHITIDETNGASCPNSPTGNICVDGRAEINSGNLTNDQEWNHIAIVQNATKTWLYLNGENVKNGTEERPNFGINMTIGANYTGSVLYTGSLDEIRIFNRTLNTTEVTNLYLSGLTTHEEYVSQTSPAVYTPAGGVEDVFSESSLTNWTISGDTTAAKWEIASGILKCTANETEKDHIELDNLNYIENNRLNVTKKDILIEYDLTYNGISEGGGIYYRGVRGAINRNESKWFDLDQSTTFNGTLNNSRLMHIKLYILGNRTGYPISTLYVNKDNKYYDEPIEYTAWTSDNVGFYNERHNDSFQIDNFKVSILNKNISLAVTNVTDNSPPSTPSSAPSLSSDWGSIGVSWNPVSDTGRKWFLYLTAFDYQDNPSNMILDGDFERGLVDYWTGYGGAGLTIIATKPYWGGYAINVSASGANQGLSQSVANFADYKGYNVYWACWARANGPNELNVTMCGDGMSCTSPTSYELTTTYSYIVHTDTVSAAATELEPYIKTKSAAGKFYVDNCMLQFITDATITVGTKDYQANETTGNPGRSNRNWDASRSYTDSGLNCFNQYTYKFRARDNNLNEGAYSDTASAYPIPIDFCTYGGGAGGYCLTDRACYYSSKGCTGVTSNDPCEMPGDVIGSTCYFAKNHIINRADDCTPTGGCAGPTGIDSDTGPVGGCTKGYMNKTRSKCWTGTSCYWNDTKPCANLTGWVYQTAATSCAGVKTCCPNQATWATNVNCTATGAVGDSYYRDTTEARCEATDSGCTAKTWINFTTGGACCGDDGDGTDTFCASGYQGKSCYLGTFSANHCSNGIQDVACGETDVDIGGPWCNSRPTVTNIIFNSSSGLNRTADNLTVYFNASDYNYDEMFPVVDWRVQRKSIARLNMPFQIDNTSAGKFKDFSSYENNGTGHLGVGWTKYGAVGGAAVFDGSTQYIDVGDKPSLNISGDITIAAWVKPGQISADATVLAKDDDANKKGYLLQQSSGTGWMFRLGDGSSLYTLTAAGTVTNRTWQMIVGTYNGTKMRLYKDGAEIGTAIAGPASIAKTGQSLYIGHRSTVASQLFKGSIDEVKVFNRSLSAAQVRQLYLDEYNQYNKLVLDSHFGRNVTSVTRKAILDYSFYENNGTLGGGISSKAPIWSKSGKVGGAYTFDGVDDYIQVNDANSLDLTKKMTLSAWVNPDRIVNITSSSVRVWDTGASSDWTTTNPAGSGWTEVTSPSTSITGHLILDNGFMRVIPAHITLTSQPYYVWNKTKWIPFEASTTHAFTFSKSSVVHTNSPFIATLLNVSSEVAVVRLSNTTSNTKFNVVLERGIPMVKKIINPNGDTVNYFEEYNYLRRRFEAHSNATIFNNLLDRYFEGTYQGTTDTPANRYFKGDNVVASFGPHMTSRSTEDTTQKDNIIRFEGIGKISTTVYHSTRYWNGIYYPNPVNGNIFFNGGLPFIWSSHYFEAENIKLTGSKFNSSTYNKNEATGTGDGSTKAFNLKRAHIKRNSDIVKVAGVLKTRGVDYTPNFDQGTITFVTAPGVGEAVKTNYTWYDGHYNGSTVKYTPTSSSVKVLSTSLSLSGNYRVFLRARSNSTATATFKAKVASTAGSAVSNQKTSTMENLNLGTFDVSNGNTLDINVTDPSHTNPVFLDYVLLVPITNKTLNFPQDVSHLKAKRSILSKANETDISTDVYSLGFDLSGHYLGSINQYYDITTAASTGWHHVAVVFNNSKISIYKDGSLGQARSLVGPISTSALNLSIGRYLDGSLDDVKIFNASLTASDIEKLYQGGLQKYTASIHSHELVKGLNWSAMLWASDNTLLSTNYSTHQLEIRNTPPVLTAPYVNTTSLLNSSKISCLGGVFSDANGDSEASREYRWYNNSDLISGASSSSFDVSTKKIQPGNYIKCSERASDGEDWSLWVNSSNRALIGKGITDCTTMSTNNRAYFLTADITNHAGSNCMQITAKNVTLNCLSHIIDGTSSYYGIKSTNTLTSLKNCRVNEWSTGIVLASNQTTLNDVNASSNAYYGLWLNSSNLDNVTNSHYTSNSRYDFFVSAKGNHCDNSVTRVNGTGNKPIRYFNYTVTITGWNNNISELVFCDADTSTLSHTKLTGSYSDGVILVRSDGMTLNDVNVSKGYNGVYMVDCVGTDVTNSRLLNSSHFDFDIAPSADTYCNNVISNVKGTDLKGIALRNKTSTISNWNNNASEIVLCNADSSSVDSVVMAHTNKHNNAFILKRTDSAALNDVNLSNMYAGIYFSASSSNRVKSSKLTSNNFSVYFDNSNSNNLTFSKLSKSHKYEALMYLSSSNIVYNNIINSSNYFRFNGTASSNKWNRTSRAGTRIYSAGTNVGGNYWTNSGKTGQSDTCTDLTGDGFCDQEVNLTANSKLNTDWLPLTALNGFEGNMFMIQNSAGMNCTLVDVDGDVGFRGTISESCSSAPGANDFIVRTADSTVQMWVDHSTCNMCLRGSVLARRSSISVGSGEFLVKNTTEAYIFKVNASGNLYARGTVTGNRDI